MDAMLGAAQNVAEVIFSEGLDEIDPRRMPFDLRTDESPQQFKAPEMPARAAASMSADAPIGYIRVESAETGLQASVGSLDPTTQTHYSIPLS